MSNHGKPEKIGSLDAISKLNLNRHKSRGRMVNPSVVLSDAKHLKKQNRFTLEEQITKIDGKLVEIARKLDIAKRHGKDTNVLESLFLKCSYRRHVVSGMIVERETTRQELQAERQGMVQLPSGLLQPIREKPAIGDKLGIPSALPKAYKVKRRILKDHTAKLGTVHRQANHKGAVSATERKALGMKPSVNRKAINPAIRELKLAKAGNVNSPKAMPKPDKRTIAPMSRSELALAEHAENAAIKRQSQARRVRYWHAKAFDGFGFTL